MNTKPITLIGEQATILPICVSFEKHDLVMIEFLNHFCRSKNISIFGYLIDKVLIYTFQTESDANIIKPFVNKLEPANNEWVDTFYDGHKRFEINLLDEHHLDFLQKTFGKFCFKYNGNVSLLFEKKKDAMQYRLLL
jgi:hypothetical protein